MGLRIHPAGSGALLLDAASGSFDDHVQRRIWRLSRSASAVPGILETVPGMNNLLVTFDPFLVEPAGLRATLASLWEAADGEAVEGRAHTFDVRYGGARGEDLAAWSSHCGLTVEEAVERHAAATYTVAAVGAMPGFPYLSGLDPRLAWGRHASPRPALAQGAVIIGGAQAGIMPMSAPSGWHAIGHADVELFVPSRAPPVLLQPGDTVRFRIASLDA